MHQIELTLLILNSSYDSELSDWSEDETEIELDLPEKSAKLGIPK